MSEAAQPSTRRPAPLWQKLAPWLVTALCFYFLWRRIEGTAAANHQDVASYMRQVLDAVRWGPWLALMIPYSLFFLVIDTAVVWRAINWFNARVRYRDVLPIRASAYIITILDERIGKGAIALYMNRRHGIPGWEIGSSMLFIMVCEIYSLLAWATLGWVIAHDSLPHEFDLIPWLAGAGAIVFVLVTAFFAGRLAVGAQLRERAFFRAFRKASPRHYLGIVLIRAPSILVAVGVYTAAAHLFGLDVGLLQMMGYVPVVFFGAAFPTPMRAVAVALWVILFPGEAGAASIFGFVQHNFFVFFNAVIGLCFLRRAYGELMER